MSHEKMLVARQLIQEKNFDAARAILKTVDDPKAREWLSKLDKLTPPPPLPIQHNPAMGTMTDYERSQARMKSYTGALVLVIVLYFILFIPGLIANILYHEDGKRMEAIAGTPLPGVAALGTLRKLVFFILLAGVVILLLLVVGSTISLYT